MTINNITFTNNSKRVTIASTRIEYALINELGSKPLSIPTTDVTNTNTTKISNLAKIIESFNINGFIITGLNNQTGPPVERTNAADVRDDLIEMAKRRSVTVMNAEGVDYNVTIEKMTIEEKSQDLGSEAPDGVIRYAVKILVVVGDLLF